MKLSICLTVALTALSVAAAPYLGSPVHLQERGCSVGAAGQAKPVPKIPPKVLHGTPPPHSSRKIPFKPIHLAPHKPVRPPAQLRFPTQNLPRPPPPKPRPAPPRSRPAPPRAPPRRPSNSDPIGNVIKDVGHIASEFLPKFLPDLGGLFRRNDRDYYNQ